jgi:hypothetical protein
MLEMVSEDVMIGVKKERDADDNFKIEVLAQESHSKINMPEVKSSHEIC